MTDQEFHRLIEKQQEHLAKGEALLKQAKKIVQQYYRLSGVVAYEPVDDDLVSVIKGKDC